MVKLARYSNLLISNACIHAHQDAVDFTVTGPCARMTRIIREETIFFDSIRGKLRSLVFVL